MSLSNLTGIEEARQSSHAVGQQVILCPGGEGSPSHTVHHGEAATCSFCSSFVCHTHARIWQGETYCLTCYSQAMRIIANNEQRPVEVTT